MLAGSGGRRPQSEVLRVGHGPSSLPGLDWLVLALEAAFHATIARGTILIALLLLLLAATDVRPGLPRHRGDGRAGLPVYTAWWKHKRLVSPWSYGVQKHSGEGTRRGCELTRSRTALGDLGRDGAMVQQHVGEVGREHRRLQTVDVV